MTVSNNPPSGPFSPGQTTSTCYAFYADDCLLHFREEDFTAKQQDDHSANIVLTAMLQVALIYMGRGQDYLALHEKFREDPWRTALDAYQGLFEQLMADVIPATHRIYAPKTNFYEHLATLPLPGERLGLYMTSGSNLALHKDLEAWQRSAQLNSKMHFAAHAPAAGIPVPPTVVVKKADLPSRGAQFFAQHPEGVVIKVQGLAGARNVGHVNDVGAAEVFVEQYDDELDVLLQACLDANEWQEMTLDLSITEDTISVTNIRRILFAQGLWVGNYISDRLQLTPSQEAVCLAVGRYVQAQGYHAPQGLNCGIDFFVRGDEIRIIEINARWTGGLFPAELLKRLGLTAEHSVAFIDVIDAGGIDDYLRFLQNHVSAGSQDSNGFRLLPMGFSPFAQTIEGRQRIYVWQVVVGDFAQFQLSKRHALGESQLPTADLIRL